MIGFLHLCAKCVQFQWDYAKFGPLPKADEGLKTIAANAFFHISDSISLFSADFRVASCAVTVLKVFDHFEPQKAIRGTFPILICAAPKSDEASRVFVPSVSSVPVSVPDYSTAVVELYHDSTDDENEEDESKPEVESNNTKLILEPVPELVPDFVAVAVSVFPKPKEYCNLGSFFEEEKPKTKEIAESNKGEMRVCSLALMSWTLISCLTLTLTFPLLTITLTLSPNLTLHQPKVKLVQSSPHPKIFTRS